MYELEQSKDLLIKALYLKIKESGVPNLIVRKEDLDPNNLGRITIADSGNDFIISIEEIDAQYT